MAWDPPASWSCSSWLAPTACRDDMRFTSRSGRSSPVSPCRSSGFSLSPSPGLRSTCSRGCDRRGGAPASPLSELGQAGVWAQLAGPWHSQPEVAAILVAAALCYSAFWVRQRGHAGTRRAGWRHLVAWLAGLAVVAVALLSPLAALDRSEEHTSELQSLAYLVCRLLLEKK